MMEREMIEEQTMQRQMLERKMMEEQMMLRRMMDKATIELFSTSILSLWRRDSKISCTGRIIEKTACRPCRSLSVTYPQYRG